MGQRTGRDRRHRLVHFEMHEHYHEGGATTGKQAMDAPKDCVLVFECLDCGWMGELPLTEKERGDRFLARERCNT